MFKLFPAEILRYFLLAIIIGVSLGYWFTIDIRLVVIISLVVALLSFWASARWRWVACFIVIMLIVMFYTNRSLLTTKSSLITVGPSTFIGWVSETPSRGEAGTRYIIKLEEGGRGLVLVFASSYPKYQYGDRLQITCRLAEETFSYWLNQGINRSCSFPQITWLSGSAGSSVKRKILEFRDNVSARVKKLLPEPESSLLSGIWWGEDDALSKQLKDNFRTTGVSHVLAVSGYNVTVVMTIIFTLLLTMGWGQLAASWTIIFFVLAFSVFSGGEAAVVRAAVMGLLVVMARMVGRAAIYGNLLLLAAALMLILKPMLLLDLGWQLSFLAMTGLLYLPLKIKPLFKWLPDWWLLKNVFIETLAATLATVPWLLVTVEKVSIISPLTNLLIVPLIPAVMFGGLVIILLSKLFWLAMIIAWPVYLILFLIKTIVHALSTIPGAAVDASIVVYLVVALVYVLLAWLIFKIKKDEKVSTTR